MNWINTQQIIWCQNLRCRIKFCKEKNTSQYFLLGKVLLTYWERMARNSPTQQCYSVRRDEQGCNKYSARRRVSNVPLLYAARHTIIPDSFKHTSLIRWFQFKCSSTYTPKFNLLDSLYLLTIKHHWRERNIYWSILK